MVDLVTIQRAYAANIDALKAMDSVLGRRHQRGGQGRSVTGPARHAPGAAGVPRPRRENER